MILKQMLLLTLTAAVAVLTAADLGSWNRVISIRPGHGTHVKRTGKAKTVKGAFVSADERAIQVNVKGGIISVPKSEVRSVAVAARRKLRWAGLGAAIGGGVGAAGLLAFSHATTGEGAADPFHEEFTFLGGVFGAGIGALIGLAAGAGHEPVFEVAAPVR